MPPLSGSLLVRVPVEVGGSGGGHEAIRQGGPVWGQGGRGERYGEVDRRRSRRVKSGGILAVYPPETKGFTGQITGPLRPLSEPTHH